MIDIGVASPVPGRAMINTVTALISPYTRKRRPDRRTGPRRERQRRDADRHGRSAATVSMRCIGALNTAPARPSTEICDNTVVTTCSGHQ
jgi:hypothetical protein